MLNTIREHADSWLIKFILWLIILAFVGTIFYSWGMGGSTGSRGGTVATVNGAKISFEEYDRTFNNLVNFYRQQFRNQFSDDMIVRLDLKTQALDSLIDRRLLLNEAEKQNIRVSDAELVDHIQAFPAFQTDNRFNEEAYRNYLKFNRMSPSDFEESRREALIIEKVQNLIKGNAQVSESEILEAYNAEEEKVKLAYIRFANDFFKNPKPVAEDGVKSYYEKHKADFEIPEQIQVEYVKLAPKDFESGIELREEDIADYYDAKVADFRVKKTYKASHILFQLPLDKEGGTEEERQKKAEETARSEAEAALKKIREGGDFAAIAKEVSDDPSSAAKGGSLGEFPSGMMVPEFEEALNKLAVGEISEPVKTPFGYHIVRLDGVTDERIKPLDEVRETVVGELKKEKARLKVRRIVRRVHQAALVSGDLKSAAKEHNAETQTTPFFSRAKHDLEDVGRAPEFYNLAFSLNENEIGEPVTTPEASFVLKVAGKKASTIPALDAVRAEVEKAAAKDNDRSFTNEKFKQFAERLKKEQDLKDIAADIKEDVLRTPYFSRADSIPGIGNVEALKDKVFGIGEGETAAVSALGRHYLVRVESVQKPGEPDAEDRKKLAERLARQKSNFVLQDWLKNLRERSDVKVDQAVL